MLENIKAYIRKFNINLDESALSFVLGVLIVGATAFLAYSYLHPKSNSGKAVIVPSVTNSVPTPVVVEPNNANGQLTPAASSSATTTVHVVQPGETMWSIAETSYGSGFDWHQIANANPGVTASNLEVGQKLTIPNSNLQADSNISNPSNPSLSSTPSITSNSYTVVPGDTLWEIALRAYGDPYRWVDIAKANNLANPSLIHSGNILTLPRSQ